MQRPDPRDFLRSVLKSIEDLPEGFAERIEELVELSAEERSDGIQRLIEESSR